MNPLIIIVEWLMLLCIQTHCVKYTETVTKLDGHPRICLSNDSKCCSKLRRLSVRSASVHYANLRQLLKVLKKYSTFTNPSSYNYSYTFATY